MIKTHAMINRKNFRPCARQSIIWQSKRDITTTMIITTTMLTRRQRAAGLDAAHQIGNIY